MKGVVITMPVKKWNNKGFTLVELVVTLFITSLALTLAGGILISSLNMFSSTASANEAKIIGDNAYHWVSEQIIYATNLQIIDAQDMKTTPQYANTIRVVDGKLLYATAARGEYTYFGDEFYLDTAIRMTVKGYNSHMVNITVKVVKQGETLYSTGTMLNLLNIQQVQGNITGTTNTELVNPRLIFSSVDDPT